MSVFKKTSVHFILGISLGLSFSFILYVYELMNVQTNLLIRSIGLQVEDNTHVKCKNNARNVNPDFSRLPVGAADDDLLAKELYSKVRVACWIMTSPTSLHSKAIHIKNTWAKRCNLVLFMSSVADPEFPAVGLDVPEGREHLTAKTMKAFKYLYDHHMEDADWFLKADDDTYVIVENLRYLLHNEDPAQPIYFGQKFKAYVREGYASGGAGYVLKTVLNGHFPKWFMEYDNLSRRGGIENISNYAVSFHYIHPNQMYTLEFFIYHLRPYGILNSPQSLNKIMPQ